MLPKDQWKQPTDFQTLVMEPSDDNMDEDTLSNTFESKSGIQAARQLSIPTGQVVGILRRSKGDIIATVPKRTEKIVDRSDPPASTSLEKEEFILVHPVDRRIPKIRIRTRQVNSLYIIK